MTDLSVGHLRVDARFSRVRTTTLRVGDDASPSRGAPDGALHRHADRAREVLAVAIVSDDVPRRQTVRKTAIFVPASHNVCEEKLRRFATRTERAPYPRLFQGFALGRVSEQEEALLLAANYFFSLSIVAFYAQMLKVRGQRYVLG